MTRGRIQVVVNEVIVADDVRSTLQDLGYEVSAVVASGEEAVERVDRDSPDLVLIDTVLRGEVDGLAVAEQIRSRSDVPIVYLTPHIDNHFMEGAKNTNPYGLLLKPFAEGELNSTIQAVLKSHPPGAS